MLMDVSDTSNSLLCWTFDSGIKELQFIIHATRLLFFPSFEHHVCHLWNCWDHHCETVITKTRKTVHQVIEQDLSSTENCLRTVFALLQDKRSPFSSASENNVLSKSLVCYIIHRVYFGGAAELMPWQYKQGSLPAHHFSTCIFNVL